MCKDWKLTELREQLSSVFLILIIIVLAFLNPHKTKVVLSKFNHKTCILE